MKRLSPADIIRKYYQNNPPAHKILLNHSRAVTRRAVKIARNLSSRGVESDIRFVAEAAMLHDIGIIRTNTPDLACHGQGPYLQHGIRGKELLEAEGLLRHARVCERHIGVGLTAEEVIKQHLPLPARDMQPETIEEQIICYADLFYSKSGNRLNSEKSPHEVRQKLQKYGKNKVSIFDQWRKFFEPDLS